MSAGMAGGRVLVLGYGNPGRQDDGLGPAAAAAMAARNWPGVTVCDNYQLVIEDALEVAAHDVVVFVDAARDGEAPYEVHPLTPAFEIAFTSHLVKPEVLLALAEQVCGASPQAWLLGIRGYEFEFLEGLTARGAENLALAVAFLVERIGGILGVAA